jgi:hypothetical protein
MQDTQLANWTIAFQSCSDSMVRLAVAAPERCMDYHLQASIRRIRSGDRKHIRKSTQDKILAVTADAISDASVVPAASTWSQIEELLDEGFTKAELARRLGYATPALQLRKDRILARTAARVDRFYRTIMKESAV